MRRRDDGWPYAWTDLRDQQALCSIYIFVNLRPVLKGGPFDPQFMGEGNVGVGNWSIR